MEEFIKSLKLEEATEKALLGAYSQENSKWSKQLEDLKETSKQEKDKIEKEFKDFKGSVKDYDLIQKELKESKESYATLEKEKEEICKKAQNDNLDYIISNKLRDKNAKHIDLLKKAINKDEITYDQDKKEWTGVDEAISKTEEQYKDLFTTLNPNSSQSQKQTFQGEIPDAKSIKSANDWLGLLNRK